MRRLFVIATLLLISCKESPTSPASPGATYVNAMMDVRGELETTRSDRLDELPIPSTRRHPSRREHQRLVYGDFSRTRASRR